MKFNIKKVLENFKKIIYMILILIIIINLISVISMKITKSGYPNVFGYSYFSVVSGSMEPTIKVGDDIIIKLTNEIEENDIVTFIEDDVFVTHRVIKKDGNNIITKGDNNNTEDGVRNIDTIIGKVILVIPFIGKIKYTFKNGYFICAIIIAYLIYSNVIKKEKKQKNQKNEKKPKKQKKRKKRINSSDDEIKTLAQRYFK